MFVGQRLSERYVYKMSVVDFVGRSREIFDAAKAPWWQPETQQEISEWLDELAWYAVHDLSKHYLDLFSHWLRDYLECLAWVRGEYDRLRSADPGAFYVPAHDVALAFHASQALWRFFCAGNRCSKTQSGYLDDYWVATNQHPYRKMPFRNQAVAIVGVSFTKYSKEVFEAKMIVGESGNVLAPLFPEGGKWLHKYDRKGYRITTACPECAGEGRADKCSPLHKGRGTISLFSDEGGARSIMGAQFGQLHIDEDVDESFYIEGEQRISTVSHSGGIVTGTPWRGADRWEIRYLKNRADPLKTPPDENRRYPSMGEESPPYASFFTIDQYRAGLRNKDEIDAQAARMPKHEFRARIMGEPVTLADNPVFDPDLTGQDKERARELGSTWKSGVLELARDEAGNDITTVAALQFVDDLRFRNETSARARIYVREEPVYNGQYIIGVDTASGVAGSSAGKELDFSNASVYRMFDEQGRMLLKKVCEWHGYINPREFAEEVKKLGIWYNGAWVVVETTGGLGARVLDDLKSILFYPAIYVDKTKPQQRVVDPIAKFGVDTNMSTKPLMVAAMQDMYQDGRLLIDHEPTLDEMISFTQYKPENGRSFRFEAVPGAKDDRVMATAFVCYAVSRSPWLFEFAENEDRRELDRRRAKPPQAGSSPYADTWLEQKRRGQNMDPYSGNIIL